MFLIYAWPILGKMKLASWLPAAEPEGRATSADHDVALLQYALPDALQPQMLVARMLVFPSPWPSPLPAHIVFLPSSWCYRNNFSSVLLPLARVGVGWGDGFPFDPQDLLPSMQVSNEEPKLSRTLRCWQRWKGKERPLKTLLGNHVLVDSFVFHS